MSIGENIRAKRIERGLTQTELGKRMGITRSTVCKVEKGLEANLTLERISKFALALNCFPSELYDSPSIKINNFKYEGTYEPVTEYVIGSDFPILIEYYNALDDGRKERLLEYARLLRGDMKNDDTKEK